MWHTFVAYQASSRRPQLAEMVQSGCRRAMSSCVESFVLWFGVLFGLGEVDADGPGGPGCAGRLTEPFGVLLVVRLLGYVPLGPGLPPGAVVDLVRREQGDPGVLVVLVVPRHVPVHVGAGLLDRQEGARGGRPVFHG